jgi:hypothetical protein
MFLGTILLYCFRLNKLSKAAAYYRRRAQALKKNLLDTASSLQDKKCFVAITAPRLEVPESPFVHPAVFRDRLLAAVLARHSYIDAIGHDVSGYICAPDHCEAFGVGMKFWRRTGIKFIQLVNRRDGAQVE